jgi:hypothetical protein
MNTAIGFAGSALTVPRAHPLFPDLEAGRVSFISLRRRGVGGGAHADSARAYPADDLTSWDQVAHRFGGGEYKAIAKGINHTIVAFTPKRGDWVRLEGGPGPEASVFRRNDPPASVSIPTRPTPAGLLSAEERRRHIQALVSDAIACGNNAEAIKILRATARHDECPEGAR